MKPKAHLFLSYSRTDKSLAIALERALKAHKISVWRDERSIRAGLRVGLDAL
jgi:hypothetical protein